MLAFFFSFSTILFGVIKMIHIQLLDDITKILFVAGARNGRID